MSRPPFGTAKIECSKRKCRWIGMETELVPSPSQEIKGMTAKVCPKCGNDSYYFAKQEKAES